MRFSLTELLTLGAALAPPELMSDTALAGLALLPDGVPPAVGEGAFEIRLEEGAERVDFEASISALDSGREALSAHWAEAVESGEWSRTRAWSGIDRFLRAWIDPSSPLHDAVHVVWLEFDAAAAPGLAPEPFLIFTLDPERFYPDGLALREPLEECVLLGLEHLACGLTPDVREGVRRFLAALPPYAQLLHLALRPGVGSEGARLIVRFPWERLPEFLEQVEWPGSAADARRWLERYCTHTLIHSFNFDVGPKLGPKLGAEFHFCSSPLDDPRWLELFDRLEEEGACSAKKRERVATWPSAAGVEPAAPIVPGLSLERDLLVKLVYEPEQPVRAKAYLTFAPHLALD